MRVQLEWCEERRHLDLHLVRETESTQNISQGTYLEVQRVECLRAPVSGPDLLRVLRSDGRLRWA